MNTISTIIVDLLWSYRKRPREVALYALRVWGAGASYAALAAREGALGERSLLAPRWREEAARVAALLLQE